MPVSAMTALATTSVTSDASITFASIPQTFRDLLLVISGSNSTTAGLLVEANNNVGSSTYPWIYMRGDGTNDTTQSSASNDFSLGTVYTDQGVTVAHFLDYSVTDKYKLCFSRNNTAGGRTQAFASRWSNTDAITELDVNVTGGGFTGTISLYGIEGEI